MLDYTALKRGHMVLTKYSNKTKALIFLKYLLFFGLFFVLNKAGINGLIYPFVFGLFFALIWCNQNIFLVSFCLIFSGYLSNFLIFNLF